MSPISVLGQASSKSSLLFCLRSLAGVIKCDTNSLILSRFVCYSYRNISIVVVVVSDFCGWIHARWRSCQQTR